MTKFLFATATAAASLVAIGTPAVARPVAPAPAPTSMSDVSPTQRICVVGDVTGSRVPRRDCRTRSDWAKAGLDPFAK